MPQSIVIRQRVSNGDYIDVVTASRPEYLGLHRNHITRMCLQGVFKSAFKPGNGGKTSKWKILRSEIIEHKINNHSQNL